MENKLKRFLSLALALFMVIGMMPSNIVFAAETGYDVSTMTDEEVVDLLVQLVEEDDTEALEDVVSQLSSDEERLNAVSDLYTEKVPAEESHEPSAQAETTATVTVYKQVSSVTETEVDGKYYELIDVDVNESGSPLENAVTALKNAGVTSGGLILISEGTLVVTNRQDITISNVTIKGAGEGTTTITGNAANFNNTTNGLGASKLSSEYKALIGTSTENVKIMDLTVDAGECGVLEWGGLSAKDFKTVRINSGTTYLENVTISGSNSRSNLMVGTTSTQANVVAVNVTVNPSGAAFYADTEVSGSSELAQEDSVLGGAIVGATDNLGEGYYKLTSGGITVYTTIPYAIDLYNSGVPAELLNQICTDENVAEGTTVAQAMVEDLASGESLYGMTADEMYVMATEFRAALAGLSTDTSVDVSDSLAELDAALKANVWGAEDVPSEPETPTVSGTITSCLINLSDPAETYISSEIFDLNATESVVIKLYSGETQIATTTLQKPEYYVMDTLGVKIIITGESSSWETVWAEGMPRADVIPDKVVLYVDGTEMDSANVPMISTDGEAAVNWADVPGVKPVEPETPAVSGTITSCLINLSDPAETYISSEIQGLNATESVVIKLYSGETQIATTTLKKTEYFTTSPLGVKIIITGESSSWETVWAEGMPRADVIPDKVVLVVDGTEMNSANVPMTGTDGEAAVNWADVPGVKPVGPVEVATYDELVAALADGKDVVLTADIAAPDKAVLTISNQTLDLGGKTLTLNGESGKLTDGVITNGTIEITTYTGDTVADGMFDVYGTSSTVSGVDFHSDKFALYAIFDLKEGDLTLENCDIDMANNTVGGNGGLFFTNGGDKLTMNNCTVTGTDIGDFIANGIAELNNCTVTLKGTVENGLDNGINGAALTLNNTTLTVDGATGRGITTDGDAIAINGTSKVTLTNCAEGGIRYKASAAITVADTATLSGTVKVDSAATAAKINDTTVAVTGTELPTATVENGVVTVKYAPNGTVTPAYTKEVDGYVRVWGEGGGNASESYVLKLYSDETLIATTALNNVGGIIDGDVYVTWNFFYPESNDEYWTTTWEEGHPNSTAQPTKVELYIDGVKVAENEARMNAPDDQAPVVWEDLGGVKYIVTGLKGSGTEADPYLINNLEELKWFRDHVNTFAQDGSSQYAGKYIKLTADIDLDEDGDGFGEEWEPIGSTTADHGSFYGTFDGDGHTISNLVVSEHGTGSGFFAKTSGGGDGPQAVVKNITFTNIDVDAGDSASYAGGVIANSGGNTVVSNVHVTGYVYVNGYGYVGGIVGHGYPDMDNCSVKAEEGSYVHANYWCAGGIIGYAGEGGTHLTDCSVSGIDVWSAYGGAAAVAGLLQDGNTLTNVSASNVEVTSASDYVMGFIAGNGEASTLTNVTAENVSATANGKEITSTDAVASIGNAVYFDLQSAIDAVKAGETVTLLRDITVSGVANAISITGGVSFTLDFNGKTLTANTTNSGVRVNISNDAVNAPVEVTLKNGTINAGSSAYCAVIAAGKSEEVALTVNIEGMTMTNCHNYGFNVKAFAYSTVNVKNGTKITSTDGQGGVYALNGSVINVYEGAEIIQKDSATTYMGANIGVSGTGVVNVYGGTFTSDKYNANVMSSGGTLNIEGGTFTSTTYGVHVDSWDSNIAAPSVANISGGTFTAPTVVWVGANEGEKYSAVANISGGTFNGKLDGTYGGEQTVIAVSGGTFNEAVAAEYCAEGYEPVDNGDGTYTVSKIKVYVAQVGETKYETIEAAFAAAETGETVTILAAGTYTLSTSGKDITITGAVDGVVFDNIGAKNMNGANVTFNNVTFDYYPNQDYTGLQHAGNLTYNNCTINGQVFLYGVSETFNNCIFNQNSANAYNVWTYSAKKVDFNECTFNSAGKSVLVYNEGACATDLTVTGTKFIASAPVEGKAAIEIDTSLMPDGTDIVINNSTAEGFAPGSISGNTLWNDKKDQTDLTVTVDGTKVWPKLPAADLTYGGYVGTSGEGEKYRENIQVDLYNVYAKTSLVVELWSGETKLSTTTLRQADRDDETVKLYPVDKESFTANIVVYGRLAGSWDTEWHVDPSVDYLPDTIKVYADGVLTATWDEGFTNDTEKAEYMALTGVAKAATVTAADGTVSYYGTIKAAIDAAQAGDTVTLLADVTAAPEATLAAGVKVDVNSKTLWNEDIAAALNAIAADGCKAVENGDGTWTVEEAEKLFSFYAANVNMGNNLDMMFAFSQSAVADWSGHYVEMERKYSDGRADEVVSVPYEQWDTNGKYYVVTYGGFAAKEMCDTITLTVYNAEGKAVSESWEDSIRGYAMRMYDKAESDLHRTLFVDLLNYGAAAQEHFEYGEADLANSQLSEDQRKYASEAKAVSNELEQGDKWVGSNVIIKSNIQYLLAFKGLTNEMYATVEYEGHKGNEVSARVEGKDFGTSGIYRYIEVKDIVVADARNTVTITIYNADGSVYTVCQDSIEAYVARLSETDELFAAFMKFADTAYAYLHSQD